MSVEFNPGRYESAKGGWYYSCDTGDSVLVGIQEKEKWTCPIVGLERIKLEGKQRDAFGKKVTLIEGQVYSIDVKDWDEILGRNQKNEWGMGEKIIFLQTDTNYIVRFHFAFE